MPLKVARGYGGVEVADLPADVGAAFEALGGDAKDVFEQTTSAEIGRPGGRRRGRVPTTPFVGIVAAVIDAVAAPGDVHAIAVAENKIAIGYRAKFPEHGTKRGQHSYEQPKLNKILPSQTRRKKL